MLTCEVTCVVGIDNFWAHLGSEQDFDEFRALELAISTYCEDQRRRQDLSKSIHEGSLGISAAAVSWDRNSYAMPPLASMFIRRIIFVQLKEPPDNSSAVVRPRGTSAVWCRARVERTMRETEEVEVYLLDYGWRLTTSVRSVIAACPEWMLVFPAFAHHCCLSGFDQTMASDSLRLSEAVETFRKTVVGQRLAAQYDPAVVECSVRLNDRRHVSLWIKRKQQSDDPRFRGTSWVESPTSLMPVAQLVLGSANIGSTKSTNTGQLCSSGTKSSVANTVELPNAVTALHAVTVSVPRSTGSVDDSRERVAAQPETPAQNFRSNPELTRPQLLLDSLVVKVGSEPELPSTPTGASAACVQVGPSGDTSATADAAGSTSSHFDAARRSAAEAGSRSLGVAPVERFIFLPIHAESNSNRSFERSAEQPTMSSPRGPDEQALTQPPAGGRASLRSSCDAHGVVCGDELPMHNSSLSDSSRGSFEQSSRSDYLCPRSKLDGVAHPCYEKPVPVSKGRGFRTIAIASDAESRPGRAAVPEPSEQRYMASATPRKDLEPPAFDDYYGERFADDVEASNEEKATFGRSADAARVWPGMASTDNSQSDVTKNPGLEEGKVEKVDGETEVQRWRPPASALFGVNQVCVVCGSTEHRRCGTAKDLFID